MKIYSEKTNQEYATVEECLAAEKEFDEKKAAEEKALVERKEKALATRKADAEKVEEAHKKMVAASKEYHEELAKFCEKHGAYHKSYHLKPGSDWTSWIDDFFNSFWF